MLFRRVISSCVFFLIFSLSLFAQGDRGTITGTVTDSAGAPMPNVAVNITNTAKTLVVDEVVQLPEQPIGYRHLILVP